MRLPMPHEGKVVPHLMQRRCVSDRVRGLLYLRRFRVLCLRIRDSLSAFLETPETVRSSRVAISTSVKPGFEYCARRYASSSGVQALCSPFVIRFIRDPCPASYSASGEHGTAGASGVAGRVGRRGWSKASFFWCGP